MKKGFTLVELLVVIGILSVLTGIVMATIGGTTDSARAAKCLANMKNLAAAVQSYGADVQYYPNAGSIEYMQINNSKGKSNSRIECNERKGWISWASEGMYPSTSKKGAPSIAMCTTDETQALFALTNGALWKYVNGAKSVYVCPLHARKNANARWSYLMNAYFGWSAAEGYAYSSKSGRVQYGHLGGAERRLLFSEVPFQGAGTWFPDGSSSGTESDSVLQYKGCSDASTIAGKGARDGNEHIGANHKSGRNWLAHVVFADGHVEKIRCSTDKGLALDSETLREVTTWLCEGKAVTFDGTRFEELN